MEKPPMLPPAEPLASTGVLIGNNNTFSQWVDASKKIVDTIAKKAEEGADASFLYFSSSLLILKGFSTYCERCT
jgi:hypothetical protein